MDGRGANHCAHLIVVRNPFDRRIRDERTLTLDEMPTVAGMVRDYLPLSAEISVAINGELITREEWESRQIKPGDQMVVMPVVHGGDDGILGSLLMIAVMVYAPYAASWAMGGSFVGAGAAGFAATGLTGTLLTVGIGMLGSAIIGGLMAPNRPSLPSRGLQSYDNSPAYAWSPATTQQPGGAVARAYGRHKLYGNIIAGYFEPQGSTGQDQVAHLLIDLGTGPYSQLSDFRINDQPIGYYSGVTITARMGHVNQDIIPAFNDTRLNRSIAAKVVLGTPITRDTVGSNYDALEIVLTCPSGLWYANDSGGLDTVSVVTSVEISADGGLTWRYITSEAETITTVFPGHWSLGYLASAIKPIISQWVEVTEGSTNRSDYTEGQRNTPEDGSFQRWIDVPTSGAATYTNAVTISGATQQPIRRTLRVDHLTRGTTYKVRCTNLSADQTSSRYGDDLYLAEINEVMYDDFQYPRTVLVGVDALANNQLSGSLKFSCMADAAIVRVWNGSAWSSVWSNNPAWVCWDILTQPVLDNSLAVVRYDGLDPSRLNLASFYAWAQFCDVSVPDGKGGTEARCTFDGVFDTPTSLWDAALEVCATARAQLVIRGTTVAVVYDDVRATPAQLFSVGNTAVSSFNETWLKMEDRAASIEVDYIDADQDYARTTLTVVNTAITESAAQRTQTGLRGVTRASQAWREANFRLKRNELLKRSASISVDIDALACTVGDLIWLQNDVTRWGVGGRAASGSTTTYLVLDQSITLDAGKTYELKLRLSDDTLVTRTITTAAGTVSAVDISVAFPSAPALYDVWAIGETGKAIKEFLVLDVVRDGDQRAKLALIEYNASLYGLDSGIPALPTPDISISAVPTLAALVVEEIMEMAGDGTILVHLDLHFTLQDAEKAVFYEGGNIIGESLTGVFRRENVTSGATYTIQCTPVSGVGASPVSQRQTVSHAVIGKAAKPADVTGFLLAATLTGVQATWNAIADIDRSEYEIVPSGGTFGTVSPTYRGKALSFNLGLLAAGSHTFWVKAIDTTGNYSTAYTAASLTVNAPAAPAVSSSVTKTDYLLSWSAPASTLPIDFYQIYVGATFGTATLIASPKSTVFQNPVDFAGTRNFFVRAVDLAGNAGSVANASVTVTAPSAPTVTAQVIDNNVLLYWTDTEQTLPIDTYQIRRGPVFASAEVVGTKSGLFTSLFETAAGTYTYWVVGIDSAKNAGTPGSTAVTVSQPPDYVLKADTDSTFSGTKSNMAQDTDGSWITPVSTSETWQSHFPSRSWATPQDQVNAGYPLFAQPNASPGYYEETIDYGTVLASNRITVTLNTQDIAGTVAKSCTISVSANGSTWTDYTNVWEGYATSFRYVKVRTTFTAAAATDLLRVVGLNIRLDSKLKTITRMVSCNAGDSGGTIVYMTDDATATGLKLFLDVDAVTITPQATAPVIPVYDFVDIPDPLSLKILLFNTAGARVSGTASLTVRGF